MPQISVIQSLLMVPMVSKPTISGGEAVIAPCSNHTVNLRRVVVDQTNTKEMRTARSASTEVGVQA